MEFTVNKSLTLKAFIGAHRTFCSNKLWRQKESDQVYKTTTNFQQMICAFSSDGTPNWILACEFLLAFGRIFSLRIRRIVIWAVRLRYNYKLTNKQNKKRAVIEFACAMRMEMKN